MILLFLILFLIYNLYRRKQNLEGNLQWMTVGLVSMKVICLMKKLNTKLKRRRRQDKMINICLKMKHLYQIYLIQMKSNTILHEQLQRKGRKIERSHPRNCSFTEKDKEKKIIGSADLLRCKDTSKPVSDKASESLTVEPSTSQQENTRCNLPRQAKCGNRIDKTSHLENVPKENDQFVINESQEFLTGSSKGSTESWKSRRKIEKTTLDSSTGKSSSESNTKMSDLEKKLVNNCTVKSSCVSKSGMSDLEIEDINSVTESKKRRQKKKVGLKTKTPASKTTYTIRPEIEASDSCKTKSKDVFDEPDMPSKNYEENDISEKNNATNSTALKSANTPQSSDTYKERKTRTQCHIKESNTVNNLESCSDISDIYNTEISENNCKDMLKNQNISSHTTYSLGNTPPQKTTSKHGSLTSDSTQKRSSSSVLTTYTDIPRYEKKSEKTLSNSSVDGVNTKQKSAHVSSNMHSRVHKEKQHPDKLISDQHCCPRANKKVTCHQKKSKNGKKPSSQQFKSPTVADVFTKPVNKKGGKPKHKLYTTQITQRGEFKLTTALPKRPLSPPASVESSDYHKNDEINMANTSTKHPEKHKTKKLSQTSSGENKSVKSVSSQDSTTNVNRGTTNMLTEETKMPSSEPRRVLRKKKPSNKSLYVFDSPSSNLSIEEIANKENLKPTKKVHVDCTPFKPVETKEIAKKQVSRLLVPSSFNDHSENSSDPYDFDAEIERNSQHSSIKPWKPLQMYMRRNKTERENDAARKGEKIVNKPRKKRTAKEQKSEVTVTINRWKSFSNEHRKSVTPRNNNDFDNFGFSFTNSQMVQNSATDESELSPEYPIMEKRQMSVIKQTSSQYSIQETKRTETKLVEWTDHRLLGKSAQVKSQSVVKTTKGKRSVKTISTSAEHKHQQKYSSEQEQFENEAPKEVEYQAEPQREKYDVLSNFSAACKNLLLESSLEAESIQEDDVPFGRAEDSEVSWLAKKPAAERKANKIYQRNINEKCRQILNSFTIDEDELIKTSQESEISKVSPVHRGNCSSIKKSVTPKIQPSRKKYSPLDVKVIQTPRTPKTPKTPCSVSWTDAGDDVDVDDEEEISTRLKQVSDKQNSTSAKDCDVISVKLGSTISKHSSLKSDRFSWKSVLSSTMQADVESPVSSFLRTEKNLIAVPIGIVSGPSSTIRPSKSTLKRKYPDIASSSEENEDESSSSELQNTSQLIPRKLFKTAQNENFKKVSPQKRNGSSHSIVKTNYVSEECDNQPKSSLHGSPTSLSDDVADLDIALPDTDIGGIGTLVKTFGIDLQQQIKQKKCQLEMVTSGVLKSTGKHFGQLWNQQSQTRKTIMSNFTENIIGELQELEKDIAALKSAEDQAMIFFKSQLKVLEQNKVSQKTRLTNIKCIHDSLHQDMKVAEKNDRHLQHNFSHVLKKDIAELQKKLLFDSQKQQLANVRKCLFGMFT
ncbi:uncharacterized protein LOC121375304 isoform X1 [Gigantopelta aegis]|uniref:uncharacterized protein LOC121375304 isoform X1 n=1 Tax=Gigantopelta aegis TaxID=1735272 RepID=UPI001B8881EF|nr:uncharacterized protein LOC121375304 isoform X1 [Gigantopelta aegis]